MDIKTLLENRRIERRENITSERAEILEKFVDKLNTFRRQDGFKPLPVKSYAVMLGHLDTRDLRDFYKDCENAKHFSKYFWWALKPK